jgi:A/G-specific adenine glycosylase
LISRKLITWQRLHGRHGLPWQGTRDPYRVWLSEVMLQQTQVATVERYYARFLQRFANVRELAQAPQDDVLALWSGLGYYSRARNLHLCAQQVVASHGGEFPRSAAALQQLPGIGRSTAAAIAALCFGERVAILDGNVKRVLARCLAFAPDLADASAVNALWSQAQALLPHAHDDIASYTQGLMDLGASLCSARAPRCSECPLREDCQALRLGRPEDFPRKSRRLKRGQRANVLLWLEHDGRWWLEQRPANGVWGALWCLPLLDDEVVFEAATRAWPGSGEALPDFQHTLTHFDWMLSPRRWQLPRRLAVSKRQAIEHSLGEGRWCTPQEALALGLPAPVRKLLLG